MLLEHLKHAQVSDSEGRAATDPPELWFAIEADRIFRVPATRLLEAQAPHAPAVYSYLFTWASPALGGRLGACHALEIPFVFGHPTHPLIRAFVGDDPRAEGLAAAMQDAWLAFARTGNPNTRGLPTWPAFDARRRATMVLDNDSAVVDDPLRAQRVAMFEALGLTS